MTTDYYAFFSRDLREKFSASLENDFFSKGEVYHSYFYSSNAKPWFSYLSLPRD